MSNNCSRPPGTGKKGSLVVISGPSGVGKGTICAALIQKHPGVVCSISATTRPMRDGEVDGVHYHFLPLEVFRQKIKDGAFLEWAQVYDNYYGTLKSTVEAELKAGNHVILEIDTEGAKQIKEKMPEAILIFILPPSPEELERRLRGRSTDSDQVICKRLQCYEKELEQLVYYDHQVTNHNIQQAVAEIEKILSLS